MMKDYYDTLGLKNDASEELIADSYQKMALRWHPRFAKEDHNTAQHHFSQISEAYEVLSNPLLRAFYDKYGYRKLREGLFAQGQLKGGYRFANNADEIFQKFFHERNAFARSVDHDMLERGSLFSHAFGGINYKRDAHIQDLVVQVKCSLSELYLGVAKVVEYTRKIRNPDGRTTEIKHQYKLLEIKPGHSAETKLVFKNQGHQDISRLSSNLIFKIKEIDHPHFKRKGNDLIYTVDISLADSLKCDRIQVLTLDNRILKVSIDEIVTPKILRQVEGQGMPIQGTDKKGNLYIRFNIIFPKQLSQKAKDELAKLLG